MVSWAVRQKELVDYISRMERSDTFDARWGCLTETLGAIGFNVVNYTVFPDMETYANPTFIENFRGRWMEHYSAEGYGQHDALISHVLSRDTRQP